MVLRWVSLIEGVNKPVDVEDGTFCIFSKPFM